MKIHLPLILMFTRFPTFCPVGPISEPGRAGDSSGSDSHFGVGSPRRIGDGKVSNSPFGSNFSVLDASYTVRIIVLLFSIVFYCIFYIYTHTWMIKVISMFDGSKKYGSHPQKATSIIALALPGWLGTARVFELWQWRKMIPCVATARVMGGKLVGNHRGYSHWKP